jgi:hypothetical protein
MANKFQTLLRTDALGATTISLLSDSLAPATYSNYDSAMRPFLAFYAEEKLSPQHATPPTMVRYTA